MAVDRSGADVSAPFIADLDGHCSWCGERHGRLCPYVKAYNLDGGNVVRVEFVTMADMAARPRADEEPEPDYPRLGPAKGTQS